MGDPGSALNLNLQDIELFGTIENLLAATLNAFGIEYSEAEVR
jgi:hypothetical protein